MTTCNLSNLIKEINDSSLWVTNLSQDFEGRWRANIGRATPYGCASFEFGHGINPVQALVEAWTKVYEKEPEIIPPHIHTCFVDRGKSAKTKTKVDIDELLKGL